jgi:hypothetical protein
LSTSGALKAANARIASLEAKLAASRTAFDAATAAKDNAEKSVITHKYRGSQQSSREVKPKFIDSIQGEPKNIYKL